MFLSNNMMVTITIKFSCEHVVFFNYKLYSVLYGIVMTFVRLTI